MLIQPQIFRTTRFLFTALGALAIAWPLASADELKSVWGVNSGDRFLVNVVIVKQTEVAIDDQSPTVSATTDKFQIDYRVVQVSTAGDAIIVAKLGRPDRETQSSSPESLKSATAATGSLEDLLAVLHVDSEGVVKKVAPSDKDSVLAHISGLEPAALRLLQQACPEEVIAGWFGRPFWIACPPEMAKPGHTWNRTDDVAVGAFGTLRSSHELKAGTPKDKRMEVEITGTGRFVPLVIPEASGKTGSPLLSDFTAELDQYTGKARMIVAQATSDTPPVPKRPQFESMEITIRLHGGGTFQPSQSAGPQRVTFRQTQIQSWNLVDSEFGRPEFLFNVPVPADPQ